MDNGFLFFGLIILLFVVWVSTGGPTRGISFQGPYLAPITTTGTTAEAYGGTRSAGAPGVIGTFFGPGGSPITTPGGTTISAGDTSTHHGIVTIARGTDGPKESSPNKEYVRLLVSGSGASVDITGWTITDDANKTSVRIPQGSATFRSGSVNQASDVLVSSGQDAYITTGASPVGASFRENLCTGYLEEHQDFSPPLLMSCPYPSQEYSRYGNGKESDDQKCSDYLRSIPYCTAATHVPSNLSNSCETVAKTYLSYNGCVAAHENDVDFPRSTWRLFLGQRGNLWNDSRDTLTLKDENGKIVDVLSY